MAAEYKHIRYFRVRGNDSSLKTFSDTSDAQTKIGFTSVWNTNTPTKTYALADSDQTLKVTYEFDNSGDQTGFKSAVDAAYTDSTGHYNPATASDTVEHFKTEWLHPDGSVSATTNL